MIINLNSLFVPFIYETGYYLTYPGPIAGTESDKVWLKQQTPRGSDFNSTIYNCPYTSHRLNTH